MEKVMLPSILERLFDCFCVASVVGIYPRFIEPKLLSVTYKQIHLPSLPQQLSGMRIAFISDIHINRYVSHRFLTKFQKKLLKLEPDLILFGGDLLTYATLSDLDKTNQFLSMLQAPLGVFACLGNHDYDTYATLDVEGNSFSEKTPIHPLLQGIERLLGSFRSHEKHPITQPISINPRVVDLYERHNITLLHNQTVQIGKGTSRINLTGLGDITSLHLLPQAAFKQYDIHYPGIILGHNPDSYAHLTCFPGDLFLFGHTHGGQVNIPFLWERITPMKDTSLKSGLYMRDGRLIFVSRGLGATFPFRLFAPPQLALLELHRGGLVPVPEVSTLFQTAPVNTTLATSRVSQDDQSS